MSYFNPNFCFANSRTRTNQDRKDSMPEHDPSSSKIPVDEDSKCRSPTPILTRERTLYAWDPWSPTTPPDDINVEYSTPVAVQNLSRRSHSLRQSYLSHEPIPDPHASQYPYRRHSLGDLRSPSPFASPTSSPSPKTPGLHRSEALNITDLQRQVRQLTDLLFQTLDAFHYTLDNVSDAPPFQPITAGRHRISKAQRRDIDQALQAQSKAAESNTAEKGTGKESAHPMPVDDSPTPFCQYGDPDRRRRLTEPDDDVENRACRRHKVDFGAECCDQPGNPKGWVKSSVRDLNT
ncbi:hypothetical protein BU24DRAFT_475496 [Aaosphaeria arxii CBS 175.79]|uniref:Uncharacterized protein n=1 Tax=Aaosphaeria arxii CBS 175.79 TaxID=1450172 RepID=A0A6A5X6L3_9PLEO|nr:uncharacterized protein BU24DRAFT_475496 [Aaosphaeria arxii CBS 175.79]KAF2008531.1 hypothetical protein BU24DRAFT_475496 [Aaosphaeria arxii CBS 175.79]